MSKHTDKLTAARTSLGLMTRTIKVGTQNTTPFDHALKLAETYAADTPPKGEPGPERGGSSGAAAVSDRKEESALARRAAAAYDRLPRHARLVVKLIDEMYRDITFLTAVTDEDPEVEEDALAGCKSCARTDIVDGEKIGGHDEKVDPKSKAAGLCRWCRERLDEYDELPVKAVHLRHTVSARAASMWLQANVRRATSATCATPVMVNGTYGPCILPVMHHGQCQPEQSILSGITQNR